MENRYKGDGYGLAKCPECDSRLVSYMDADGTAYMHSNWDRLGCSKGMTRIYTQAEAESWNKAALAQQPSEDREGVDE